MPTVYDLQSKLLSKFKNEFVLVMWFMSYYSILVVQLTCVWCHYIGILLLLPYMYTTTFVWTDKKYLEFGLKYKKDVIPVQIYIYFAIVLTHKLTRSYLKNKVILRNRKHVPCFYQVIETWVEVWRTKNAAGTRAAGECFHSFFELAQTFTSVSVSW